MRQGSCLAGQARHGGASISAPPPNTNKPPTLPVPLGLQIGAGILRQVSDYYRKLRGMLRFLLGNLADYDPQQHQVGGRWESGGRGPQRASGGREGAGQWTRQGGQERGWHHSAYSCRAFKSRWC
jgi:hypothetical protein